MTDEQNKAVVDALVKFIVRVVEGNTTSEAEVAALPEVVKALDIATHHDSVNVIKKATQFVCKKFCDECCLHDDEIDETLAKLLE